MVVDHEECSYGEPKTSVMHYIAECPITENHRPEISSTNLLFDNKNLRILTKFFRETNFGYDGML